MKSFQESEIKLGEIRNSPPGDHTLFLQALRGIRRRTFELEKVKIETELGAQKIETVNDIRDNGDNSDISLRNLFELEYSEAIVDNNFKS